MTTSKLLLIKYGPKISTLIFGLALAFVFLPKLADAASLSIAPSSGEKSVGETFDVSVFVNTEGQSVNAVSVSLTFPPDKLQIASPVAGNSIIEIYTTPPRFNNQLGRVDIAGGVPGGINVSKGLITTLTFRAKSPGPATIRFLDTSKVLLNDGHGTDALTNTSSASYLLSLPPPQGPVVSSETHPDQEKWYKSVTAILKWAGEDGVDGYSYMLSDNPVDLPDDINEEFSNSILYRSLGDGTHYFHIKAHRKGDWGGVTHFAIKIDNTAPALFPVGMTPGTRTSSRRPLIEFSTTDALSGIDHYELKIVPLKPTTSEDEQLFIEAVSPFAPDTLDLGGYNVIVRAYDKAGNIQEVSQRLDITTSWLSFVSLSGIQWNGSKVIPWKIILPAILLLLIVLILVMLYTKRWHKKLTPVSTDQLLPGHIKQQLEELNNYRRRYGKLVALVILSLMLPFSFTKSAQADVEIAPPLISSYSKILTNEEIFYIEGRTQDPESDVVIYLQNLQDGQTFSLSAKSDKRGDWFYRHTGFVSSGKYVLWAQSKIGDQLSPPSSQVEMSVKRVAFSFTGSRITYESFYLTIIIILSVAILIFLFAIIYFFWRGKQKKRLLGQEIRKAEESIRRGFALLRRDIEAELQIVKRAQLSGELSGEGKIREEQLLTDLKSIEQFVGQEIWEAKKIEGLS